MVTDAFCTLVLSLFKQTTTSYAQLHTGNPGPDGLLAGCIDNRRMEIRWGTQEGPRLVAQNALVWKEVQGIPGFPQTIDHLTIWSDLNNGTCWATIPLAPIRVPHLATLEIPLGLTLNLSPATRDH